MMKAARIESRMIVQAATSHIKGAYFAGRYRRLVARQGEKHSLLEEGHSISVIFESCPIKCGFGVQARLFGDNFGCLSDLNYSQNVEALLLLSISVAPEWPPCGCWFRVF